MPLLHPTPVPIPALALPDELSAEAASLIRSRITDDTRTAYRGLLKKYVEWIRGQPGGALMNPFPEDNNTLAIQVANWVAYNFHQKNLQAATLRKYVAAVSSHVAARRNSRLGDHTILKSLMAGVRRLRPELPKYTTFPRLGRVWKYLEQGPPLETLDAIHLTGTTVILLIIFGLRKSDQLRINLKMSDIPADPSRDAVLCTTTKESQDRWVSQAIPACRDHPKRCAVAFLRELLRRRERNANPEARTNGVLFVAERSGIPVGKQWLASTARTVMADMGFDVAFGSHSFRGAGASTALNAGIPQALVQSYWRWSGGKAAPNLPGVDPQQWMTSSQTLIKHYTRLDKPSLDKIAKAIYGIDIPVCEGNPPRLVCPEGWTPDEEEDPEFLPEIRVTSL